MISFRQVTDKDWDAIAWLASDAVQEGDHGGLETGWVEKRLSFDGQRLDLVAEASGDVVGYCAIEHGTGDAAGRWRVFLLADWDEGNAALHEALLARAAEMLAGKQATLAWMREFSDDARLIHFVRAHGFDVTKQYTYDGREMVNLEKGVATD